MKIKNRGKGESVEIAPLRIRSITPRAFFRRLSVNERSLLRARATDAIADIADDLAKAPMIHMDDPYFITQLTDAGMNQARRDILLADGTAEETRL